ncbi:MAG: flagellar basal body rod protein FlgC [Alphaproteobacteria bacterium]|nr:flagellar basal body rod protein FlgC [Alphaproteobacteria bacterium]MCB9928140.1 flagellar basal body rod protein FlgC [Alphaproteobacteria bacterium]
MQDNFSQIMTISAAGMRAQGQRLKVASENLANVDSPGYRRKLVYFREALDGNDDTSSVRVDRIGRDTAPLTRSYDPSNPLADRDGYVTTSNVNPLIEMMDMKEADRSYSAGLRAFDQARDMFMRTLDLLRR